MLADIGTANFNNKLEKTLHEQKEEKTRQQWLKIFADYSMTEIKANELWSSKYMDLGCLSGEPNDEKISDYIKQYDNLYYAFAYGHSPYIRADRSDSEEQSAEEIERKRKNEEAQRRRDEMRDLFSRAFKLRLNFIKNYSFTDSKKNVDKIANWAHIREIVSLINRGMLFSGATTMDTNSKMLKELYGINDKEDYSVVAEFTKKHPEKALLMTVYAQWCDSEYNDCYNWEGNYKENQALNELYRGLCALGYQMSDEEKQMLDGSHPIYSNPDDGVIDTAYDKIETETEDEISDDEFDIDLEKRLAELANQKIRED